MEICVCGAQVPFMHGGAELHMENLLGALEAAGHRAELVRLPVAWDRGRLFESALAWRLVPLDADLVIATNFPSYFVHHPNKVVWLFHQHRAAYDAVDSSWSDFGLDDASLEDQRLLTEWDAHVLAEARQLFSTSRQVADRVARYNGLSATPLYHPPPLADRLHPGPSEPYAFCPTRLESNKRPQLIVDSVAHLDSDLSVRIAGKGSLHEDLLAAARATGRADRVELLGFVSDDELVELYAGALAVVYPPYDEDYGYVTLQAFLAGKPVVTTSDSGGVLEWVEDGVSGFVTDGSPAAIAEALDLLRADPEMAARMGEAGRAKVAGISWTDVVTTLVGP